MRAFITGAGGGIGGAIKELYLHSGYEVVAPRSTELDLSDMSAIHDWFSSHRSEFDAIIHCAGYNRPLPAAEIPLEEFMKTSMSIIYRCWKSSKPMMRILRNTAVISSASVRCTHQFPAKGVRRMPVPSTHWSDW